MTTRRTSTQRERIYGLIAASRSHPTAEEIYRAIVKEAPRVSLGNVYRNLGILIEEGRIQRGRFGDGREHYDAITAVHYHFICDSCGGISDLEMPIQESVTRKARGIAGHAVKGHTIQFFGTCRSCLRSGKDRSRGRKNRKNQT